MNQTLTVSIGQYSAKGRKAINQDFHGAVVPSEPQRTHKGIAVALADGISSSTVSQEAAESAIKSFLDDYYCTSDAWTVRTAAERVLRATNTWLHAQTRRSEYRYERDKGYVCTFSALVLKSNTAHLFHVGDARIYRVAGRSLEQLTRDHRVFVSREHSHLARALGIDAHLEIDYQALPLHPGDTYVLATDGVYEHIDSATLIDLIRTHADHLDAAARLAVQAAFDAGSTDNLTALIVRVDSVPLAHANEIQRQLGELKLPPQLEARMMFDGFEIIRQIHASHRSHIFLARDLDTGELLALKTPSFDMREDPAYLERFLMEEWVARRLDNAHVLKPHPRRRAQAYVYVVMEYVEGITLAQWMRDNPRPELAAVRDIVAQIARGLQAFHRKEMLHQDLRPENIIIDAHGTAKIIDFGSTHVAGLSELAAGHDPRDILGTHQYAAPEYFTGDGGNPRSDLFSLGVIAYQMLTGHLPYGATVARATTRAAQQRLRYRSALDDDHPIPAWMDEALRKAVHPLPDKRYESLSEFITDLKQPNSAFRTRGHTPLIERNPVRFWKGLSIVLGLVVVVLLGVIRALV
ncbi:bifunctional protein-serine/threonine kinase/phosphatase [Nitrogeniibacter mangrovi]|uniref:Bifunctional protein-serine/threonine kinase/phosphatase n=1 Tax=Nitrogeniibacter mangrovi TaxID=2016596 RepID=A0A6C1B555_9RHOO|nr:bifunctional protein-serine/threonine kinase/phosphatase [Nitrogeniibacter mangrovi]QID18821.1 bifunctional protein-serine/threonine kinase/phosphatase [Nitrogeniibacter mangrovi]